MSVIYTNENNPAALKLVIAVNLSKKPVEVKVVTPQDKYPSSTKHLPHLEVAEYLGLFISNAAARYLFPPTLDVESIDEWLEWEAVVLTPSIISLGSNCKNEKQKNVLNGYLKHLDCFLQGKTGICGVDITVADVAIWSTLYPAYKEHILTGHENLLGWMKFWEEKDQFKHGLAQIQICGLSAYASLLAGSKYLPTIIAVDALSDLSPQQPSDAITSAEIESVQQAWQALPQYLKPEDSRKVRLPEPGKKNILITSALPYVNNVPHLGNIIGCVLSADTFARFCRLCDHNTMFLCGTDEYGTATETKALEEGISCRVICDKYFRIHSDIYRWFNIGFDYFGRTSTPQQTELCQEMFHQLNTNGFMFVEAVEQLHCSSCNRYLADRFVEGGCPHPGCNYPDARGDQCDGCSKLVNAIELKNPRCKICGNAPTVKKSEQFFFDLPKLEPLLLHWMKTSAQGWSSNAQVIGRSWLREGLKPRCITRDLKWGVSVPVDGFREKVFYVWFDAPLGYMSITKAYTDQWEKWWRPKPDTEVKLYQFMAKDNVPFHAVMFPAALLGANKGYLTVSHIYSTEYLNYEDGKFSKSRGIGVFGNDAQDTGISSDVWRFYLLYVRPETQDSSFSWSDLATKNNSELLNNLGNFVNRALVFAKNNFGQTVPEMFLITEDHHLLALCTREFDGYVRALEKAKLRDGIRHILAISRHGNQYMQSMQPWVLLKGSDTEKARAGTVIGVCCNLVCLLATLLHPYMPDTSRKILHQLNTSFIKIPTGKVQIMQYLPPKHKMNESVPLFTKIEAARVEELKKLFAGKQSENGKQETPKDGINELDTLQTAVTNQANKVRELKSKGAKKEVWSSEVQILLDLKKKLEIAESKAKPQNSEVPITTVENGVLDNNTVKQLEEEIEKQGSLVRKLKSSSDKSVWQPEVNKLLELKSKLATAVGSPLPSTQKGKKGKKQ